MILTVLGCGECAKLYRAGTAGDASAGVRHRHCPGPAEETGWDGAWLFDPISGGRLILGLGAAWVAAERADYGIPFPPPADRVALVGETLEIARRAETRDRVTFHAQQVQIEDASFEPEPVNGRIPVMIVTGAGGCCGTLPAMPTKSKLRSPPRASRR